MKITFDNDPGAPPPRPGDVLRTVRGRVWLILAVRRVRSRVSPSRWTLTVERDEDEFRGDRLVRVYRQVSC